MGIVRTPASVPVHAMAVRRRRWVLLVAGALALGCDRDHANASSRAPADKATRENTEPTPGALAQPSVPSPDATEPAVLGAWRSVPVASNGFYAIVDGLCSQLAATRVGRDVVVRFGGGSTGLYKDGIRLGPASFIGLRDGGFVPLETPTIAFPTGVAGTSLDDLWIADSTGTRSGGGGMVYRKAGGAWQKVEGDQTEPHAWVDGGVIGTLGFATSDGQLWSPGRAPSPPSR